VEHVRRRAALAPGVDRVLVATDDERIADAVRAFGGEVVTTGGAPSGTHRCRLAIEALGGAPDVVVNVQGDQPLVDPAHIAAVAAAVGAAPIATAAAPLAGDPHDPHLVKVVFDSADRALYFSRAAIPHRGPWWHHAGIYAFTPAALRAATDAPRSPLCLSEDLEQLAWLEAGLPIRVVRVDRVPPGVDTPAQLDAAIQLLVP
jgi:3-deoxy-manno-octulosonate cytidylyltransferase (CMP-KDO synthetase)